MQMVTLISCYLDDHMVIVAIGPRQQLIKRLQATGCFMCAISGLYACGIKRCMLLVVCLILWGFSF